MKMFESCLGMCLAFCLVACGDSGTAPGGGGGDTGGQGGAAGTGGSAGAGGADAGCRSNEQCGSVEFCELETSCRNVGECVVRPDVCPLDFAPVCGCDNATYDNACLARRAGVRVSGDGACDCTNNNDCDASEYCNAITCDGPGTCTMRPDVESCDAMPNERVANCSEQGFDNACFAAAAGSRVAP